VASEPEALVTFRRSLSASALAVGLELRAVTVTGPDYGPRVRGTV
jgi:hypothetical protein